MSSSLITPMNCSVSSLSYSLYSHSAAFVDSLPIQSWPDSLLFCVTCGTTEILWFCCVVGWIYWLRLRRGLLQLCIFHLLMGKYVYKLETSQSNQFLLLGPFPHQLIQMHWFLECFWPLFQSSLAWHTYPEHHSWMRDFQVLVCWAFVSVASYGLAMVVGYFPSSVSECHCNCCCCLDSYPFFYFFDSFRFCHILLPLWYMPCLSWSESVFLTWDFYSWHHVILLGSNVTTLI